MKTAIFLTLALTSGLAAQTIKLGPRLESLSRIAREAVDVTMDSSMLRFAEKFLSDKDVDEAKAKRALKGVNRLQVKVLEFDQRHVYSMSDLDEVRSQVRGPGWSKMIEVMSRDEENVEVYTRFMAGEVAGMVVLVAEPRELSIIQIDGPIRVEDLAALSGRAGLPHFAFGGRRR
jgi:hypothetical protein